MSNAKEKTKQGPFGYGDPDDLSLRKVEKEVLIPKKMREIAHREKCTQEVSDFNSCCKDAGLLMVVKCRPQNTSLWNCLEKWYHDEAFRERCTKEYLEERSEFRRTGVRRNPRNQRAEIWEKTGGVHPQSQVS